MVALIEPNKLMINAENIHQCVCNDIHFALQRLIVTNKSWLFSLSFTLPLYKACWLF